MSCDVNTFGSSKASEMINLNSLLRETERKFLRVVKGTKWTEIVKSPMSSRVYPTSSVESSVNWYSGTSRLRGAGPLRIRPEAS